MSVPASDRSSLSFGHYTVVTCADGRPEELGRGAMGITYKAIDTTLERCVALKVINPDHIAGEETRQRFLREARAAAQLRHPNAASVFHLGVEGGTHFYAMEFIDGQTLEALVQRFGPMPCGRVLDLAAQAASALGAAHAAHLVHRDIKPANLMVIDEPGGRFLLKVIDFGLAKSAVSGGRDATVTMGGFVGTPHFASPEQLEEKELDIRSDIYSLGATLWYLLTGQTLYSGSLARVMIGHISETPAFDRLVAPPGLRALLRRMLAKNAADRPQTPDALLNEIRVAVSQLGDPEFMCRLEPTAATPGCAFTLQELLRARRFLPPGEALIILRKIAEALDSVDATGRAQVDLTVHAMAIDFPEQATLTSTDLLRQPVGQWPLFGLKFRERDPGILDTIGGDATLLGSVAPLGDESYLQQLAGIASELLGGRQRAEKSATTGEFVPLAALSEEGNAVLQAALVARSPEAYPDGMAFLEALQNAEKLPTPAPVPVVQMETAVVPRTRRLVPVTEAPDGPVTPAVPVRASRRPLLGAALIILAGGGVLAAIAFSHRSAPPNEVEPVAPAKIAAAPVPEASASASPAPAVETSATPLPPTPAATPAPPVLDADQQLKIAIGESAEYEAASDWKNALVSAVRLVRDFPTYDKGPERLEDLLQRLTAKGEFGRHWPTYEPVLQEAADLGSGHATLLLGLAAKKDDPARALPILQKAADLGVHEAMTQVGQAYLHGEGVPKDVTEAERWFQKASDHGDPAGMFILGESYLGGQGVKQDNAKALKLIQDAADHRSGDAKNLLAKLYLYGRAGLTMNRATALEYFRQAKDLKCPEAFYNLGMLAYTAKGPFASPGRAASLFEGGAKLGHSLSMFYYARCLDEGTGVPMSRSDATTWYAKALDPLKKGAESGERAAMVCYAMALDQGLGADINPPEARRWYAKAATLGDTIAQQWCYTHHVDFQMSTSGGAGSAAASSPTLTLPHKVNLGNRVNGLPNP